MVVSLRAVDEPDADDAHPAPGRRERLEQASARAVGQVAE
jgi:hypothetical protein